MKSSTDKRLEHELRTGLPPADPERTATLLAGLAASAADEGLIDVGYGSVDSPLGRLLVAATPAGVVRMGFDSEGEEHVLAELARRISPRVLRAPRTVDDARRQLTDYFDGRRHAFELPLDWRLTTGFRRRVLRVTAWIPYGDTKTYRQVATIAGNPAAVRAAGSALANNPLAIIVPCHRVLRTDGGLGGYRGGIDAKQALLDHERTYRASRQAPEA
jgi:methylated-DNA-[protein]-cysteine S-methyltransferase